MATRSSSRIKNQVKADYTVPDEEGDENINTNTQRKRKPRAKKASPVKKGKKAVKKAESESDDDVKPAAAVPSKRKQRKKAPSPLPDDDEIVKKKQKIETKINIKDEKLKGKVIAPVDSHCKASNVTVYTDSDGPWDAMLNQTNVGQNNNKYYLCQLLQAPSLYYTWFRWGRIGYSTGSQTSLKSFGSLDAAMSAFKKKFKDKTNNSWEERHDFCKYPNKYDLIKLDYSVKEEDEVEVDGAEDIKQEPIESKLDPRVLSLMELISNVKQMESTVVAMNYDVKKSPLGKLSKEQIKSGYEALTIIERCIKDGNPNCAESKQACSMFYTRIPHSFGFQVPPLIKTLEEVKLKIELLDTLIDIEACVKAIRLGAGDTVHKADSFYSNLKIEMKPLEKDGELFKMLSDYLHNTHGSTHSHYTLVVEDIFELKKEGEEERFTDVGNKQLLWHGSRLTNWGGIFSQGLRIAPPEAPVTGYMFGKGVYFADMASKSANYCFTSRAQPTGILLLAEVSLGEERELLSSDYNANKLPAGKHSTKGLGKTAPNPADTKYIGDVKVPLGTPSNTGVDNKGGYSLQYNEFIVYDVKQIKMKYALRVKFNYKR